MILLSIFQWSLFLWQLRTSNTQVCSWMKGIFYAKIQDHLKQCKGHWHNNPSACLLLYVLFSLMRAGIRHSISQTQLKFSTSQVGLFVVLNEIIDAIKSEVVCQVVFHSVPITWRTDPAVLDSTWPPEEMKSGIRKRKFLQQVFFFWSVSSPVPGQLLGELAKRQEICIIS